MAATVHFADIRLDRLETQATLPAKFLRVLDKYPLAKMVKDQDVAVKVHLGANLGYTTIPPLFMRLLIKKLKEAGGRVFVTDLARDLTDAASRGYTQEVLGAPLLPTAGLKDRYYYSHPADYNALQEVQVAGMIQDADVLINFSHVKGHGACGYGGACKNLAMGCVMGPTRSTIHGLEGGYTWVAEKCTHCQTCIKSCRYGANKFKEDGTYQIFNHLCTYCQHCANACPQQAITLAPENFVHFQEGMATATKAVLDTFDPEKVLHLNLMLNITMVCDCWGMSMPSLVPDIGLAASTDIVAIEQACLDLIKFEELLPSGLPKGRKLLPGDHLFERVHGKNPFVQVKALERHGLGTREYVLKKVR